MNRLYRSTRNKMITGLCGGLSEVWGIDATILRILVLISIPFTGGTTLFIYFIAALVIPKEYVPPFNYNGNGNPNYGNQSYGHGGHTNGGSYNNTGYGAEYKNSNSNGHSNHASDLDDMMKDIEKKALKKEVEELKIKLSKYEKGEV
jgi:phage shock protein C